MRTALYGKFQRALSVIETKAIDETKADINFSFPWHYEFKTLHQFKIAEGGAKKNCQAFYSAK
jgi:hypothetical protein